MKAQVKIINKSKLSPDTHMQDLLFQEVALLKSLEHPNILVCVRVYVCVRAHAAYVFPCLNAGFVRGTWHGVMDVLVWVLLKHCRSFLSGG